MSGSKREEMEKKITADHFISDCEHEPGKPNSVPPEQYVNFNLAPGEYLLQCPYNSSHRILPARMGKHMVKCRLNYEQDLKGKGLEMRYVMCPWTDGHIIPEIEIQHHSSQCNFRGMTRDDSQVHKRVASERGVENNLVTPGASAENWDDLLELNPPSYKPHKKLETEPIFYMPKGLSKARKKQYRDVQRLKFYHLVSGPFWAGFRSSVGESITAPGTATDRGRMATDDKKEVAVFVNDPFKMRRLCMVDEAPTSNAEKFRKDKRDSKSLVDDY